ncbi:alpha/beta hydrolase family esterase [Mycobacterium nebraskense]|uniref:Polyhydroxybutyrate depolymerase n=1 Tax=Mycobacterium nebraskense TaxID=244292 RepID=A0A0F5N9W5_9MYCO|nr:PHB depolymerase family esterase [Mycobacterium nebraskense]KKC03806.1 polyhydroxybutyrate depolymerase [Mycobacterium nebraskense]KLO39558.1 polyhydroxybutyrate depolymerase [Mycobacterium nebraskense]MBI2693571.1 prolyl oligopeptidase family serine peptidase [Mycobacterium nebraskense]MCV7116990.1 prolyl oligopeptidase family serine peptidase [Mycobacterium nebraskense]ORW15228.1 polyhydroxybutyrate depolymerase [Mycobacterium nebraskense]
MLGRLATLLGVALLVAGCSPMPPSGFVTGTSLHHINVGGHDRSYRLYEPAGRPASAPLVVALHGYSGSAQQVERAYGWDELADSGKFLVAYPDGLERAWNVYGEGCCGRPGREGVDDVAFITAAVADIAKHVGTDPTRVYVTGMSNGGIMSYTLACTTDIFAAIGPVAGTQLNGCRNPHPASIMHIHGTADRLVPYGGGQGFSVINGPSVPTVNTFWRNVDQCANPVTTTDGPVTTSTAGCAGNRGVTLITIDQGGHEWPSFAAQTLWQFFAAHPR